MRVSLSEQVWEAECEELETVPFLRSLAESPSYPRPPLRRTGRRAKASIGSVAVENAVLKFVLVPDLGGRILSVHDRRSGRAIWNEPSRVEPHEGGPRGMRWDAGLSFLVGTTDDSGLGPVSYAVYEPATDSSSGGVIEFGLVEPGIDWHACTTLDPDRADILIELRVHNRTLRPLRSTVALSVGTTVRPVRRSRGAFTLTDPVSGDGFLLEAADDAVFTAAEEGRVLFRLGHESPQGVFLGPRQTRTYRVRLMPQIAALGLCTAGDGRAAGIAGNRVWVSAASPVTGKVQVLGHDGSALESPFRAGPAEKFEATLDTEVAAIALIGSSGEVLLDSRTPTAGEPGEESPVVEAALLESCAVSYRPFGQQGGIDSAEEPTFWAAVASGGVPPSAPWGLGAVREVQLGKRSATKGDPQAAVEHVDRALLYQGDDQLLWWFRAVCERRAGSVGQEPGALLNGRYLAPLDPVFRAEAFLSTSDGTASGVSPLVRPLADDPVALIDVAGLYVEHGFTGDAARLLTEALKFRECPLARYLLAWCLSRSPQTAAESAYHVQAAAKLGLEPPFPIGVVESCALLDLKESFPNDAGVAEWASLVDTFVRPRFRT